jgi:hypothetical protein
MTMALFSEGKTLEKLFKLQLVVLPIFIEKYSFELIYDPMQVIF